MDSDDLTSHITSLGIPRNHATVGLSNYLATNKQAKSLFIHRRLPDAGWSDLQIQHFLLTLSTLDTNSGEPVSVSSTSVSSNQVGRWCGVGEREGRVYSSLVIQRHCGLSHGIGRSGDVTEPQPKAVGSSTMSRLALHLVLDAARRGAGLDARSSAKHGVLLPLCTGMSMGLVFAALRDALSAEERPKKNVVLWSRIDQKSCFKAILSAGLVCEVVPTKICDGSDEVVTDLDALEKAMSKHKGKILAVVSTTSCFAPRVPDSVDDIARLCDRDGVSHVMNNAYGLQCAKTCKLINRACAVGRVDAIVCSTDKNLLVPVGGAIVMSPREDVVKNVGKVYPGRASAAPIIDLFITLLSMGLDGYRGLLQQRTELLVKFQDKFAQVASKYGERPLSCPRNSISFGITLDTLGGGKDTSYFGSMLFTRCVSGTRVVPQSQNKVMGGQEFVGFGSSTEDYPHSYLTAACAIGLSESEMNEFFSRLEKGFKDFFAKQKKEAKKKAAAAAEEKKESVSEVTDKAAVLSVSK
mmetsp:Transcript_20188/g.57903  ORF Transcript_20188/g.57903 Transcript_20188/m.57903 type:complete len:524 (+) Transcript_20188:119-1690(+)|eukprot:CAMPEP_0181057798 /NCGR_PEP_ID=MMETSP1070-20121207/20449_1 /TAXON_ID=265543 /ORGANISM="Minutocellus polymorphus, Strain NH13" /LENGTH=523 /DNA_ID=CAMNT_0023137249 /DNA_START=56 /DNA_END=1627 /DNA_ORIENTATION=-